MKTQVIITIEHPDAMSASWFKSDVVDPFISDINSDSNDEWTYAVAPTQTEEELRSKALRTALLLTLSDFPEALTNEWVIDAILNGDERIDVWQTFEHWDREDLVNHIEDTAEAIYNTYFE